MSRPIDPETLRPRLDAMLLAWRQAFGWPVQSVAPYELQVAGPDLILEVSGWGDPRTFRGRLSAFGLLAGRFWAAAELEPEAHRLCPAFLPTLLETHAEGRGLSVVMATAGFSVALRAAARLFDAAGEHDEAALCLARCVAPESPGPESRLEPLLLALKESDPVRRLAAVRGCEAALRAQPPFHVLETFRPFVHPLRALLADVQPALHERSLALSEDWARRLWARRAYREALHPLDVLAEASVAIAETLRMRHESRLAIGDLAGARNDRARLTALRARVPQLEDESPQEGSPGSPVDLDAWEVSALTRVATAHLSWAAGADPCPDRPAAVARPPRATRVRHMVAARARIDEALAILGRRPGGLEGDEAAALLRMRQSTHQGAPRVG